MLKAGKNSALISAIYKLSKPLTRLLLKHGISFKVFAEIVKRAYVEEAANESSPSGKKPNQSRIAVMTGLTRKEVQRLLAQGEPKAEELEERHNRAIRVVSGWMRDVEYSDSKGHPALLRFEGKGATFSELVKKYSGDMPARSVLNELIKAGAVKELEGGKVKLLGEGYVPDGATEQKMMILGKDVGLLINTIAHNLDSPKGQTLFQKKVMYDNLPEDVIPRLKLLASKRAQTLLEDIDAWCAEHDRDTQPEVKGKGKKEAGIGIFYFEENSEEEA